MTSYRLSLLHDTETGGQGTPLPWGEPEEEVGKALEVAGASWIGFEGGTAFLPGAPRDVSLYVDQLDREQIMAVLVKFPHGLSWDVEEDEEE